MTKRKSHSEIRIEKDAYWKGEHDRRFIIYVEVIIDGRLYSFDRVFHQNRNLNAFEKKIRKTFKKDPDELEKLLKEGML